jgi:hypothetical protein
MYLNGNKFAYENKGYRTNQSRKHNFKAFSEQKALISELGVLAYSVALVASLAARGVVATLAPSSATHAHSEAKDGLEPEYLY